MDHSMKAAELFLQGYNCAQAITVAFSDVTGLSEPFSAKMASSFGGGMGRMREVCGAVSGMLMVATMRRMTMPPRKPTISWCRIWQDSFGKLRAVSSAGKS